jgi:hypothetical protein
MAAHILGNTVDIGPYTNVIIPNRAEYSLYNSNGIVIGNLTNSNAFTSGTVMFGGNNLTVHTSTIGNSQFVWLSIPPPSAAANAVIAGDNISLSTSGVSTTVSVVGLDNYALSWHSHDGSYVAITNSSLFQQTSDNSLSLAVSESSNFVANTNSTLFQSAGAYLTTAANSTHIHGVASGTNITIGSSSNGLALSVGNYLTTAAQVVHSHTNSLYVATGTYISNQTSGTYANRFNINGAGLAQVAIRNGGSDVDIVVNDSILPHIWHNNSLQGDGIQNYIFTDNASVSWLFSTSTDPNPNIYIAGSVNPSLGGNNITLGGNTSGTMALISSGTATIAGGNNITLSQNGNAFTIIGAAPGTGGAGTGFTSASVTGNIVNGSLLAGGLSLEIPNYLTTAMASNAGSNFIGLNTAITNGSMTANSSGISINIPSATASASNSVYAGDYISLSTNGVSTTVSVLGNNFLNTAFSTLLQHTSATSAITANAINTSQSSLFQHTSVTSAITSNAFNTSNSSLLQLVANSTLSLGTGYTTHTHNYAATNHTHGSVNIVGGIGITSASSGLSVSIPSYLTTAANSTHTHGSINMSLSNIAGSYSSASNGLNLSLTGSTHDHPYVNSTNTGNVYFVNSLGSNITWSSSTTGSSTYFFATAGGGTGATGLGTGFSTVSTAGSVLTGTLNTAGMTLAVPAWLTVGGTGGGGVITISAGSISNSLASIVFSNSNNVSFGLNGSTITASIPMGTVQFSDSNGLTFGSTVGTGTASLLTIITGSYTVGTAAGAMSLSAGTLSNTYNSLVFSNSNNISFGLSGSTLTGSIANRSLYFNDSNGVTFGSSTSGNSTTITGSHNAYSATSQLSNYFAIPNHTHSQYINSSESGSLYFVNSNGISFGSSVDELSTTITASMNMSAVTDYMPPTGFVEIERSSGTNTVVSSYTTLWEAGSGAYGTRQFRTGSNGELYTQNNIISHGGLLTINEYSSASDIGIKLDFGSDIRMYFTHNLAQSTHTHGNVSFNLSNVTANYTSSSNGLTIGLTAGGGTGGGDTSNAMNTSERGNYFYTSNNTFLTTAALSNHIHSDLYQSTGAYLTTAMLSQNTSLFQYSSNTSLITGNAFHSSGTTKFAGTGSTTATTSGSDVKFTINSLGLNLSMPKYLTTAMASANTSLFQYTSANSNFMGINTAGTNITWTANSSGISINGAGYAGTGTTMTNASATLNSNGLQLNVPKGQVYFQDSNGHSWSSSTNGVSTTIYIVT